MHAGHELLRRLVLETKLPHRNTVTNRAPLYNWSKGRIALAGNAAHPGACLNTSYVSRDCVCMCASCKVATPKPSSHDMYTCRLALVLNVNAGVCRNCVCVCSSCKPVYAAENTQDPHLMICIREHIYIKMPYEET
jgi:hypothetical protein